MSLDEFDDAIAAIDWSEVDDAWSDPENLARRVRDVAYAADGAEALAEVVERLANSPAELAEHAWRVVGPLVTLLDSGGGSAGPAAILDALWSLRACAGGDDELGWGPGEDGFAGGALPPVPEWRQDAFRRVRADLDARRSSFLAALTGLHGTARAAAAALLGRGTAPSEVEWAALARFALDEGDSTIAASIAVYAARTASTAERYDRMLPLLEGDDPRAVMTAVGLSCVEWRDVLRPALQRGLAIGRLDPRRLRWSAGVVADACAEALTRADPEYDARSAATVGDAYERWAGNPDASDVDAPWPVARRVGQWFVLRGLAEHRGTMTLLERDELDAGARDVLRRVDRVGARVVLPALLHCGIGPRPGHLARYLDGPDGPLDRELRGVAQSTERAWPVWKWMLTGELQEPMTRRAWPAYVGGLLAAQRSPDELVALADDLAQDGYGLAHLDAQGLPKRSPEPARAVAHAMARLASG